LSVRPCSDKKVKKTIPAAKLKGWFFLCQRWNRRVSGFSHSENG